MKLNRATLALALSGAVFAGATLAAQPVLAQQITGAGGTFPAPVYAKWGQAASKAIGIELNYQAIGSGGGQNQILQRTVDFGASDAPMAPAKLASGDLLQVPSLMGAVVMIVNLPGVKTNQLKLTGALVADIYSGTIKKWNDPKLVALNHGVKLPSYAIAPVHRADASGTSYVFTSFLAAVSPDWKSNVGVSTSVAWPAGSGAKGNDGVAGTVKNTRGAIGYVENAYATENNLTTTQLRNKAGKFVDPTMKTFGAAASNADWANAKNFAVDLIDQPGADSWPIVSATFLMIPKDPKNAATSANVLKFIDWCYANGDQIATSLQYIPLPTAVKDRVREAMHKDIVADGKPVWK